MWAPVPSATLRAVKNYDSTLRVRWARHSEMYFVEKKMPRHHPDFVKMMPSPYKSGKGIDVWEGWKDGYLHVLSVHPSLIHNTPLILEALAQSDAHRQGGWEAINRKLDEALAAAEKAADRATDNFCEAAAREAHDVLQWRLGNRVAITGPQTPPAEEAHDGFVVRVRKVTA